MGAVRGRLVAGALVCAAAWLAAAGCGDDGDGIGGPAALDGQWSGSTSQGRPLSFSVSNRVIGTATIDFLISGSRCTIEGFATFPLNATISGNSFTANVSAPGFTVTVDGEFESASKASGSIRFDTSECDGSTQATWTAEKGEASSSASLTGTWRGSYSSSLVPSTPITLTLAQSGGAVNGTYAAQNGASGTVNGTVSGSSVTFSLISTLGNCPGTLNGSATLSGNRLDFTFSGSDCLGTHTNGRGTVTRQ